MRSRRLIPNWLVMFLAVPIGLFSTGAALVVVDPTLSDAVLVALLGALFGFLGSLLTAVPAAVKARAESRRAAKQTDLDALRQIITELRAEREMSRNDYRRLSAELEAERVKRRELGERVDAFENLCDDKDREIEALRCEVGKLREELTSRDQRITDLVIEVDELRRMMKENGIEPPPRRRNGGSNG